MLSSPNTGDIALIISTTILAFPKILAFLSTGKAQERKHELERLSHESKQHEILLDRYKKDYEELRLRYERQEERIVALEYFIIQKGFQPPPPHWYRSKENNL